MSKPLLQVRELNKSYDTGAGRLDVLRDLNFDVASGESLAVVGDSGVGKSTLLQVLGALDRADSGSIKFRDEEMCTKSEGELRKFRNRSIGFIFQFHHLLPEFTALENVEMPFRIGRREPAQLEQARALLVRLGLEGRLDHVPSRLSGGEQQRVAIARALAPQPDLVLADEPTGNLDPSTGAIVYDLLRDLQQERGFSLVLATHSERLARQCGRVCRMVEGGLRSLTESELDAFFLSDRDA